MTVLKMIAGRGWTGRFGLVLVLAFVVVAVAGSLHGDPLAMESEGLLPPSLDHPFGTDNLGRDLFSRTGHGAATSLLVSVGSVLAATVVALPLGLLAAWHRRRPLDSLVMRTVELAQAVPPFILVIVILGLTSGPERHILGVALTPTLRLVIGLAVGFVPYMTRVVRSVGASELEQDYVEGLLLIGVRPREVLGRLNLLADAATDIALGSRGTTDDPAHLSEPQVVTGASSDDAVAVAGGPAPTPIDRPLAEASP